ncbi:MAG TPA: right-handed parallel beta-helix repeat-containing protein, partial [Syntrophorhabdaceae bacterium]|nr:right-handed parallel beta-helix repeat-containing protein [Syntrophorhabdaceae bacterium]
GALGGIQIIAGSERIKVQENEINGGAGNGITLGSTLVPVPSDSEDEHVIENRGNYIAGDVLYKDSELEGISLLFKGNNIEVPSTTGENGFFEVKTGPGKFNVSIMTPGYKIKNITLRDQTEDKVYIRIDLVDKDIDDVPVVVYDVQIDRNEISNMALSGIGIPQELITQPSFSSTTLSGRFGLSARVSPIFGNPAVNISIHRNHIFNCLQSPFIGNRIAGVTQLGFGGISLGMCRHLSAHGNRIENNGIDYIHPVCGIFIGYGEHVDISHNYIVNNGPLSGNRDANPEQGIRGGIIMSVSSFPMFDLLVADNNTGLNGRPAARVHDNVVDQPAGQALRIMSSGPVSVLNNQFNSEWTGTEISGNLPFDQLAGAALIYGNVSLSNRGNKVNAVSTGVFSRRARSSAETLKGNILFNSNQVRVGSANESITSLIIYAEDIGFEGNQSDNLSDGTLKFNTYLFAYTLRASNNRFKEPGVKPEDTRVLSLNTQSILMNNTTNNQGDHCITAINPDLNKLVDSGNLVLSGKEQCDRSRRFLQEYIKNNQQFLGGSSMTDEKELDNFIENLQETLIILRDVRIEALNNLTEIQVASRLLLQHEAVRLEKKFGKEHPRTQNLKNSLKQNLDIINDLEVEKEITRIKIPEISQDEALIHGRVMDANYRGIGGLMVCIIDSRERILNDPEKSTTDDSGYYSIIIGPDKT